MATDGNAVNDQNVILKGKGGANAVFEYKNIATNDRNYVLRIRTRPVESINHLHSDTERALEAEVWQDLIAATGNFQSLEADVHYIHKMILPLIGPQYIAPQILLHLNDPESIRYGAAEGVLMPDATLLHHPTPPLYTCQGPTVCIELKPKYGGILPCLTVPPEDIHLKHSTSRYQLHQILKSEEKSAAEESKYNPIDLFSEDPMRIEMALVALMDSPQNNLSLFMDGRRVNLKGNKNSALLHPLHAAGAALMPEAEHDGMHTLVHTLRCILQQECVLQGISKAQRQSTYDIEGIYRLYCHLLGENVSVQEHQLQENNSIEAPLSVAHTAHKEALESLLSLPRTEAVKALKDYCISATSKDCSVMIAMQRVRAAAAKESKDSMPDIMSGSEAEPLPRRQGLQDSIDGGCGIVRLQKEPTQSLCLIRYRVTVVDLDRKPLVKIRGHYDLDKRILAAARRRLEGDALC